jgi:hypothetical protein
MVLTMTLLGIFVVVVLVLWLSTRGLRRRRIKTLGTTDVVVRCSQGHLFTTIRIAGASPKPLFGYWRGSLGL